MGLIDETVWQWNQSESLTPCWPWDETWVIRLPGREIKQCHSLPVGHGMRHYWWNCSDVGIKQYHSLPVGHKRRHDWWDCLPKKRSTTHSLLGMPVGWDMVRFTWRNCAVTHPLLQPCDKTYWDCLAQRKCGVSHILFESSLGFSSRKQCNCSLSIWSDVWDGLEKNAQWIYLLFPCSGRL